MGWAGQGVLHIVLQVTTAERAPPWEKKGLRLLCDRNTTAPLAGFCAPLPAGLSGAVPQPCLCRLALFQVVLWGGCLSVLHFEILCYTHPAVWPHPWFGRPWTRVYCPGADLDRVPPGCSAPFLHALSPAQPSLGRGWTPAAGTALPHSCPLHPASACCPEGL